MQRRFLTWSILSLLLLVTGDAWCAGHGRGSGREDDGASDRRGEEKPQLMLANADGATVRLWKPDLTSALLEVQHGGITIPNTGMDNYHALVATRSWSNLEDTLIRYEYLRGKPSGHSPSELAALSKSTFEIVPDPIPREHYRYLGNHTWDFLLRFKDAPLADTPVTLSTSNGTQLTGKSDAAGRVRFVIPDDFPEVQAGPTNNKPGELWLTAEHQDNGVTYHSALSAAYFIDPAHWQSKSLAAAIFALGLVAGGIIGRVRKPNGEKSE
jgi:hypothetical protein